MKNKFFLSISLLAFFGSINSTPVFIKNGIPGLAPSYVAKLNAKAKGLKPAASMIKKLNIAALGAFALPFAAVDGYNYMTQDEINAPEVTTPEVANRSYLQVAKDSLNTVSTKSSDLYNSAKITASDMYANATYENIKNTSVNGFNSTKTFVQENPYKTAGGVAAVAALTYGAYKLYNSDMFAKAQAPVVTSTPAPVKKQVRRPRLNMSSNYGV